MSADRFEIEPTSIPRESGRSFGCFKGCLAILGLLLILLVIVFGAIAFFWRTIVGRMADFAIQNSLAASSLPAEEQDQIRRELQRILEAFQNQQLSADQFQRIIEAVQDSPLLNYFLVSVIEAQYLGPSGLTPAEKKSGQVALQRFISGMFQGKIPGAKVDEVLGPVAEKRSDGTWELRNRSQVGDGDLRAFLAAAKKAADEAEIPAAVPAVDPSEEVKRIVDVALGEAAP